MAIASTAMPEVADRRVDARHVVHHLDGRERGREGQRLRRRPPPSPASPTKPAREAAHNAIAGIGGVRLTTGDYTVVFGREAVMEILHYILMPGLDAATFYAAGLAVHGQARPEGRLREADDRRRRRGARASSARRASPTKACPPAAPS